MGGRARPGDVFGGVGGAGVEAVEGWEGVEGADGGGGDALRGVSFVRDEGGKGSWGGGKGGVP